MFQDLTSIQYVADRIKAFVLDAKVAESTRQILLRTINELETLPWVPIVLERAHAKFAPMLTFDETLAITYEGHIGSALVALDAMLRDYITEMRVQNALIAERMKVHEKEYTAEEAAKELEISPSMFATYTSRKKLITGRKVGKSILYSQDEIDYLRDIRKPVGRPAAKNSESDA